MVRFVEEKKIIEDNVFISVIVPVYNAEKYLDRCLQSILAQTYTYYEIILINDGSTDTSEDICEKYVRKDKRIRIIQKENSGVAITRNIGLEVAKGRYISFIDSDDYIKPDMFEKMIMKAKHNDSDMVMCKYFIDNAGEIHTATMDYHETYDGWLSIKEGLLKLYYEEHHNGLYSLCNKLIKRSIYVENDISFDVSLRRGEDAWFIFQCLKHCRRVDFIPGAFYYYYQNTGSIMHTIYEDQYEKWVYMRKLLLEENKILKINIDYSRFYKEFLYKVVVYCRELIKQHRNDRVLEIIQDEFYLNALKHAKKFPIHIKIIHYFTRKKYQQIVIIFYKLWAMV